MVKNGGKNSEKNVVHMYVKQEPESCSSIKNYPSVKMVVFSDCAKRRILVLRRRGNYPPTTSKLP